MTACVKIAIGATRGLPSPRRRPSVPVCQGQGPPPPKRIVLSPTLAAAAILVITAFKPNYEDTAAENKKRF